MVATHAKMARGQMARYIVRNRIDSLEEVLRFSWEGFTYSPERSTLEEDCFSSDLKPENIRGLLYRMSTAPFFTLSGPPQKVDSSTLYRTECG